MERLPGEPLRVLVVRQQLRQLVAEDRDAARLEPDDRDPGADLAAHAFQHTLEVAAGQAEEAVVVERAAAAEVARRQRDAQAGAPRAPGRRGSDVRLEVVRERVGPEDDVAPPAAGPRASNSA